MAEEKLTRKEQAENTRKLLFNTAMELLEVKPFEQITIRDIVSRAGVSIGSFYNYYSTKLDVFYETYIAADEFFEDTVKKKLQNIKSPEEQIYLFFDYYAYYSSDIAGLSLTSILYNTDNTFFDRSTPKGMRPILSEIIRLGQADEFFRTDLSPEEIASFMLISVRGQVYDWCTHNGDYSLKNAVREHVRLLLEGMKISKNLY